MIDHARGARLGMSFRAVWDEYDERGMHSSVILDGSKGSKKMREQFLNKVLAVYDAACEAEKRLTERAETSKEPVTLVCAMHACIEPVAIETSLAGKRQHWCEKHAPTLAMNELSGKKVD